MGVEAAREGLTDIAHLLGRNSTIAEYRWSGGLVSCADDIMIHSQLGVNSAFLSKVYKTSRVQIKWEREALLTDFCQCFVTASVVLMRVQSESNQKATKAWLSGCPVKERLPWTDTIAQDGRAFEVAMSKTAKKTLLSHVNAECGI